MSNVSVVFDADTGKFVANVAGMEKATAKAAQAVADAKNKILAANKEQIDSAQKAGASTQELEKIQTKSASAMANVTERSAAKIIASLDRISEKNRRVAAELANLGQVKGSDGHGISDRMAASSLVRGLENGNVGIRTVENFITTLPGASAALQGFFAVAGPIAFAAAVGEGVKKLVDMRDAAIKLPTVIREGWEGLNEPLILSIDTMRKVNDELEIAHQKFTHKPENQLALAIDEDRIRVDKLAESARKAALDIRKMLTENMSGTAGFLLAGKVGTGKQNDEINGWVAELAKKQMADQDAIRGGKDTPEAAKKRKDDITAFLRYIYTASGNNAEGLSAANSSGSLDNVIANYRGVHGNAGLLLDQRQEGDRNAVDERQQGQDKQAKDSLEAGRKAAEERAKAAEAQFKQMEARFAELEKNADGELMVTAKIRYWEKQSAAANLYAENVARINEKLGPLNQEYYRKLGEYADKAAAQQKAFARASEEDNRRFQAIVRSAEEQAERAASMADKLADAKRNNADATALQIEQQLVATGVLSRHDAAVQLATRHEAEYQAKLADIANRRDRLNARLDLDDDQKQAGNSELDVEKTNTEGARDRQSYGDRIAIDQATVSGALRQVIQEFEAQARDGAAFSARFAQTALNGTNEQILRSITGQKTDYKGLGRGLATDVAGFGLRGAESAAMKALRIGTKKPAGTSADPIHVVMSDIGKVGSAVTSGLGKAGGWLSSIGTMFGLPGFASGGVVSANTLAMVGENGPEPVFFGESARVMSNTDMRSALGASSGGHIIHVDARGATDPAQVRAQVMHGIAEAAPHLIGASVSAVKNTRARLPATKRF